MIQQIFLANEKHRKQRRKLHRNTIEYDSERISNTDTVGRMNSFVDSSMMEIDAEERQRKRCKRFEPKNPDPSVV